jgi:hypothetical protein
MTGSFTSSYKDKDNDDITSTVVSGKLGAAPEPAGWP